MANAFMAAGVVAVVAGGVAIGYAATRSASGGMPAAMAAAVAKLDGDINAARAAVHASASQISSWLTVRAAVATNAQTVADQVAHGELAFRLDKNESIELGRIVKATHTIEPLTIQPPGATPAAHGGVVGRYAELAGGQIVVTEVAAVVPVQQADDPGAYAGFLAVTRKLPLAPAIQPLLDAGITGKLVIGTTSAPIGVMRPGAATREQPLSSQSDAKIIAAEPPAGAAVPMLAGGIAAAAIGVLLLVISAIRQRAAGRAPALGAIDTQPGPPQAVAIAGVEAELAHQRTVAAGAPAPADAAGGPQLVSSSFGPGAMIGRWEVVRRLGSGGMADVYLAHARGDGGFEKLVAIKVMHGHLARNQRAVEHFLDEARLAARIQHPNVVAIQDLGKIGNDYVIVMEYVEGVDLERLLISTRQGGRPVPIAVALGILCRICDGLDAAHRATAPDGSPLGIVHRDVKSANVLVSRQGSVKVVDFGIAKAAKQVHYTAAGEIKGTLATMAPEQRVGDQVDVRVDVYSAAAVGYELVTGQCVNLDLAALAHLGVENWPHLPPPSSLRADLPPELDRVLLHAMAFERERRPADCAALGGLCEAVMKRHGLVAGDKDIARWADAELRLLSPPLSDRSVSKPPAG